MAKWWENPSQASESITQSTTTTSIFRQHQNFVARHPDGKISKKEFSEMMRQCYPDVDMGKVEKHIFRMYDANGDGSIDFRYAQTDD